MKTTKTLLILVATIFCFSLSSCKKCKGEDPTAKVINNGTHKTSVQIKTSGGNTININNIEPGASSDYASYAAGDVEFTVSATNKTTVVQKVKMETCFQYDIMIDDNNAVTFTFKDLND